MILSNRCRRGEDLDRGTGPITLSRILSAAPDSVAIPHDRPQLGHVVTNGTRLDSEMDLLFVRDYRLMIASCEPGSCSDAVVQPGVISAPLADLSKSAEEVDECRAQSCSITFSNDL